MSVCDRVSKKDFDVIRIFFSFFQRNVDTSRLTLYDKRRCARITQFQQSTIRLGGVAQLARAYGSYP